MPAFYQVSLNYKKKFWPLTLVSILLVIAFYGLFLVNMIFAPELSSTAKFVTGFVVGAMSFAVLMKVFFSVLGLVASEGKFGGMGLGIAIPFYLPSFFLTQA